MSRIHQPLYPDSKPTSLIGETSHSNFVDVRLTRSGLEPEIYRTLADHAKQYTTDTIRYPK